MLLRFCPFLQRGAFGEIVTWNPLTTPMKAGANGLLSFQLATARSWPTSDILQNKDWLEHVPMWIPIQSKRLKDETTKLSGYPFSWLTQICADLGDFRPPDMVDFTRETWFCSKQQLIHFAAATNNRLWNNKHGYVETKKAYVFVHKKKQRIWQICYLLLI